MTSKERRRVRPCVWLVLVGLACLAPAARAVDHTVSCKPGSPMAPVRRCQVW